MSTSPAQADAKAASCPICGKAAAVETRPFCSRTCRDRDLLKWLDEDYRTPVAPEEGSPQA